MQNCTLQDNSPGGLLVSHGSIAEIADSTITHNYDGMLSDNATIVFRGVVKVNNNRNFGIGAGANATLEVSEGSLEASGNGGNGINLNGAFFSIGCFTDCRVTANDNGVDGMFLGASTLVTLGDGPPGSTAVTAMNNKGNGITLVTAATLANIVTGRYTLKGNTMGLSVGDASVVMVGGLDVEGNTIGLLSDGAGSLNLSSIPPNPSVVRTNRTADADLRFGTRITVDGVAFGTPLKCEPTVLSRGTTKCP